MEETQKLITEGEGKKSKKNEFMFNMIFLLVLGLLLGIGIKTEATKRITVGFDDYKIEATGSTYDINEIQKQISQKEKEAAEEAEKEAEQKGNSEEEGSAEPAQPAGGAACGV